MMDYFKKIKRSSGFTQFRGKPLTGFTLVELLVVLAVFSTSMMVAMQIFYGITRTQRQASVVQKLQGDARFVMESMAKEARLGTIDYDYYANQNPAVNLSEPTYILATVDQDGNRVVYKLEGDKITVNGNEVTPAGIRITRLKFYIYPISSTANDQPRVTIVFSAEGADPRVREQLKLDLQTTVSSRRYSR